jgi:hypothetical protein
MDIPLQNNPNSKPTNQNTRHGRMLDGNKATSSTAAMVLVMILIGFSGSMSVVGPRVASQRSVPDQDVALVISLLSLWSKICSGIGSAIVVVIWSDQMPK